MVAYTVGMVTGAVCMVMPLVYAMNVNRCIAGIMEEHPEFDPGRFVVYTPPHLLYGIAVVGAFVLVLSAIMTAAGGRKGSKSRPPAATAALAEAEPDMPEI